ncbi:hypothetical protein [Streptomyces sp. NPDC088115]|uniref:hypothetical protein n=1 Tax=Streptomyces sp. NPDC088115 TaxID=3365824 RepID=UPI003811DA4A
MSARSEALVQERIRAAGYRAREPFPGRVSMRMLLKCIECGEEQRLRPDTKLKPCEHKQREQQRRYEEYVYQSYYKVLVEVRTEKLQTKNLRALEALPGVEGELWWVQCKFCNRVWHMRSDKLRACPHKGAGDPGHPPLPAPAARKQKAPSAPPPAVADMTVQGRVDRHAYVVEVDGQWDLRVSRYPNVPEIGSSHCLFHALLPEGSPEAAEEQLRASGWEISGEWSRPHRLGWVSGSFVRYAEVSGFLYAEVKSPLLTEYVIAQDILGSVARKPELTAQRFLKRHHIDSAADGIRQGTTWPLYFQAEVEAAVQRTRVTTEQ